MLSLYKKSLNYYHKYSIYFSWNYGFYKIIALSNCFVVKIQYIYLEFIITFLLDLF